MSSAGIIDKERWQAAEREAKNILESAYDCTAGRVSGNREETDALGIADVMASAIGRKVLFVQVKRYGDGLSLQELRIAFSKAKGVLPPQHAEYQVWVRTDYRWNIYCYTPGERFTPGDANPDVSVPVDEDAVPSKIASQLGQVEGSPW